MIVIHHLEHSRSQRILWLLEELGIAYEIKPYKRDAKSNLAPPELKAVHPLGKSPVITDGDLVVAETASIIDYLITTYGKGRFIPTDPIQLRAYNYWMHYAEGSAMTPLLLSLICNSIENKSPLLIRPIAAAIAGNLRKAMVTTQLRDHIDYWDKALSSTGWFCGAELSGADFMMSFPLEAAAARADALTRPHIKAFLQSIHARPAYKAALVKGGPYAYA